jgi:two-component system, OmpR family, sensor histidine kinase MtrB
VLREDLTRFERLVADLLEISRADAGPADIALEEVRLGDLVRLALSRQPGGRFAAARLTVHPSAREVVVLADKRRLERVLGNLLDNAEKHGGGVREVRVEATAAEACITVDDAGPGVPEDDRARIFERFARGTGSSRADTEGAGLGLSLVARHVRAMGGSVTVTDSPAGGARFLVRLPVREATCDG